MAFHLYYLPSNPRMDAKRPVPILGQIEYFYSGCDEVSFSASLACSCAAFFRISSAIDILRFDKMRDTKFRTRDMQASMDPKVTHWAAPKDVEWLVTKISQRTLMITEIL